MATKPPTLNVTFSTEGKKVQAVFTLADEDRVVDQGAPALRKAKDRIANFAESVFVNNDKGEISAVFRDDGKFNTAVNSLSGGGVDFRLVPPKASLLKQVRENMTPVRGGR